MNFKDDLGDHYVAVGFRLIPGPNHSLQCCVNYIILNILSKREWLEISTDEIFYLNMRELKTHLLWAMLLLQGPHAPSDRTDTQTGGVNVHQLMVTS